MANVKATDLIDFTRASKGHALAKVSYGSEEVVNGSFDTDSDWTTQRVSIVSGVADFSDNSSGPARIIQDNVYTVGKTYLVTFDVNTSGTLRVYDGSGYDGDISVSSGTVSKIIYAEGTQFIIRANVTNDYTGTIDNVSVKEVLFNQPDGSLQLFEHPNNIPRIEYDADGNLLGLLIEESRTNLQANSGFTVTPNTRANTVLSDADDILGLNALRVTTETGGSNDGLIQMGGSSVTSGTTYTFSVYVRIPTGGTARVQHTAGVVASFNDSGVATNTNDYSSFSGATVTSSSVSYGNGVFRLIVTANATANGSGAMWLGTSSDAEANDYCDVAGPQMEVGSFATSYIETLSGSTVTRSADVASIDVDQFGYNQSEGTLFAEVRAEDTTSSTGHPFYYLKNDTSNYVRLDRYSAGFALRVRDGGTYQVQALIPGGEPNTTDLHKVSAVYKANDFAYLYNGGTVGTDTSGTIPDGITTLHLSEGDFNGHIKSITYTPKRLSNAKLQELTS